MKRKSIVLILILCAAIYLNRSYAYFYDYIGAHYQSPPVESAYNINEGLSSKPVVYVALGDSLTAGVGATQIQGTYPYALASQIAKQNYPVVVFNLAVPGAVSKDVLDFQLAQAINKDPDFISLLIGINDIHNFVPQESFKENIEKIIEQLQLRTHAQITLINIPYLGSNKILLPPYSLIVDSKTSQYNQILEKLALENHLKYIDLFSRTKKDFEIQNDLYSADQFHPSNKGYQLWGKIINAN